MRNMRHLRESLFGWLPAGTAPNWEAWKSTGYSNLDERAPLDTVTDPVRWLTPEQSKDALIEVAEAWFWGPPDLTESMQSSTSTHRDDLSEIQGEVWCGLQRIQPMPDVAVLSEPLDEQTVTPLGVLCGYPNYAAKHFFISHIAVHPVLQPHRAGRLWHNDAGRQVYHSLVDAAIDWSQQMECHGWVACSPPADEDAAWQSLKFYRHDGITLRRMGHFTS